MSFAPPLPFRRRPAAIAFLLSLFLAGLVAGEAVPEYRLKAELIERLARFVEWPAPAPAADPSAPFVIGVLGRDPFAGYLDRLAADRSIQGRAVRIRRLSRIEELGSERILFVGAGESRGLARIVEAARARSILTVGDSPGYGEAGVMINFFADGERVRFEVNEEEARRAGLRIDSKLRRLARPVGEESP